MTSTCVGATGLMSLKETVSSVSRTMVAGMSPAAMLQNAQPSTRAMTVRLAAVHNSDAPDGAAPLRWEDGRSTRRRPREQKGGVSESPAGLALGGQHPAHVDRAADRGDGQRPRRQRRVPSN